MELGSKQVEWDLSAHLGNRGHKVTFHAERMRSRRNRVVGKLPPSIELLLRLKVLEDNTKQP
ncbi:unnamed protein product [Rodentolepis nana]|uniref:Uncharacterized protein n=1 Tax=Rodentolepis nana TaxID=102285 RepID=A0A3P7V631_RODNA|nr:unnamed protein product [Rodentolepis nana]